MSAPVHVIRDAVVDVCERTLEKQANSRARTGRSKILAPSFVMYRRSKEYEDHPYAAKATTEIPKVIQARPGPLVTATTASGMASTSGNTPKTSEMTFAQAICRAKRSLERRRSWELA
jgi:hypothetical protein